MRLAAIGTSNTLMQNGYRAFLEALEVAEIGGFALGGAPNVMLPYMLQRVDCDWYDTVVIDTFVNDMWNVGFGDFSAVEARRILADTLAYLRGRGMRVVVLLLPTDDPALDHVTLRADYIAIATLYGASVVDGYEVVQALLDHGVARELVFLDPGHFRPQPALLLAQRLADRLRALPARAAAPIVRYPYTVHALPEGEEPVVVRSTALMQGSYRQIGAGETVRFRFAEPCELLALALNEANTSAVVEIRCDSDRLVKDLRFAAPVEPRLRHCLTPFLAPPRGREITVRVLTEAEAALETPERSSHARPGSAGGVLELEAIVTRDASACPAPLPSAACALPPVPALSPWERGIARLMEQTRTPDLSEPFRALFGARDFGSDEMPDLLRDIGRLAMAAGETDVARNALSLARRLRPEGPYIRQLLAELG